MSGRPDREQRSVLIVDDDCGLYDLLRRDFERRGWSATRVATDDAALEQLKQGGHDLVLVDLRARGVGGVGLIRRIRKSGDPVRARVPVVACAPYAGAGETALAAGADDYLVAPCVPSHFVQRAVACVRSRV